MSEALATALGRPDAAIIPIGVDLEIFSPIERAQARRALGWPEDGYYALFPASRAARSKRADLFDAALDHARRELPDLRGVSLEGVDRHQVALTMNAADVTVMTSDYEGSPVALKESLACCTPVVSVPVGDVEILLEGVPGCAVVARDPRRLGEALLAALGESRAPELRDRASVYRRAAVAERVVDVYRSVLAGA